MATIKLEQSELNEVKGIIKNYADLGDELRDVEKQISILLAKENEIRERLTSNRQREFKFSEDIRKKYGDGFLNVETLEYQLKNS